MDLRDPFHTLRKSTRKLLAPTHHLDRHPSGLLALYCDGNHLYVDTDSYRSLFDGYEQFISYHPGLHLVRREDFKSRRLIRGGTYERCQNNVVYLQHTGFSGQRGERTAHVWFATGSQFTRPWQFKLAPGTILSLITDHEDWCLETIWMRKNVNVRRDLLSRKRYLT